MKLKDIIKQYREKHGYSQRKFAELCGFSNGYICMLESKSPSTGNAIKPNYNTLKRISIGMGISIDDLLNMLDDDEVVCLSSGSELTPVETGSLHAQILSDNDLMKMISKYYKLSDQQKELIRNLVSSLAEQSGQ